MKRELRPESCAKSQSCERHARSAAVIACFLTTLHTGAAAAETSCAPNIQADVQGNVLDSEEVQRREIAKAVACEWEQQPRNYANVARYTEFYVKHSNAPACQILLFNAQANLSLARNLEKKGALEPDERERLPGYWRKAWDVLAEISASWNQAGSSQQDSEAMASCVVPARELLSKFPSVTITVDPEDIGGYDLRWDGQSRSNSLPRILPGIHQLEVDAPAGYSASLSVDGKRVIAATSGTLRKALRVDWLQRVQVRVELQPSGSVLPQSLPPTSKDTGSSGQAIVRWGGATLLVAGLVGVGLSLSRASALDDEGNQLFQDNGCASGSSACPESRITEKWDSASSWRSLGGWGFGAVAGVGAAGIIASFFMGDSSSGSALGQSPRQATGTPLQRARLLPVFAPGQFGLDLQAGF